MLLRSVRMRATRHLPRWVRLPKASVESTRRGTMQHLLQLGIVFDMVKIRVGRVVKVAIG